MAFEWGKFFSFRRSPSQGEVSGARRFIPGAASLDVGEDTAMTVSAFHRGVTYISTQIAKLPWDVKDVDNNIKNNSISILLALAPNPEMNAMDFRLFMVQQALILGNAYAEIQRDTVGRPIALWPLNTRDVSFVRSYDGTLFYRVTGNEGPDVYIPLRDMFHVKNFHTKDGLVGQGLLAYASQTLGISVAADRMASGLFNNGGMPSGILSHPGIIDDAAYERIKTSWKESHGGRKAGGVAVLEEGVKYEAVNLDPEVLQFLESRKFGVLEIARFLGLPPTKLFDTTAATFSNIENANLEVATDTLDAWACKLEIEADVKLLNNRYGGQYTELDLYAVFRGDMKTRAEYNSKMMQMGAITPNQVRAREGMPGYSGGDRFYIARNNYVPQDRQDELIDAELKSKETKDVTPPEPKAQDETTRELNQAALHYLKK